MQDRPNEQELKDRLDLIERMIAEGRRTTENWGWAFVLWGVAYYVALAWSAWGHSAWAWPASALIAVIITVVMAFSRTGHHAKSILGHEIGSIWISLGISMFLLFFALGLSGRLTDHLFVAVLSAILGMANGASAMILRWKAQWACAFMWWATAVTACFANSAQNTIVFVVAIFLCQIVFGIYGMIAEAQQRKPPGALHA
jgi:hypothetical protein